MNNLKRLNLIIGVILFSSSVEVAFAHSEEEPEVRRYVKVEEECLTGVQGFLASFGQTLEDLGTNCLELRTKAPATDFEEGEYDVAYDYVESDKSVCDCFRKTLSGRLESATRADRQSFKDQEDALKLKVFEANIEAKKRHIQAMTDGMLIQANYLSSSEVNEEDRHKFISDYNNIIDKDTERHFKDHKRLLHKGGKKLKLGKNKKEFRGKVNAIQLPVQLNEETLPSDEIPLKPAGSCFSMKTYTAWDQRPKDPDFLKELNTMDYDDKDWNMESLKKEYDIAFRNMEKELISKSDRKKSGLKVRVKVLKARMQFIRKNPIYGNFFSAPSQSSHIKEKKKELLKLLKKQILTKDNCLPSNIKCKESVSNQQKKTNQSILEIFKDPEVWDATRGQLNESINDAYKDSASAIMSTRLPRTQPALEKKYLRMTGTSLEKCNKDYKSNTEADKLETATHCNRSLPLYCSMVEKVHATHDKGIYSSPSDELEEADKFNFNLNPETNAGFRELTDLVCKAKRVPRKNPKGPAMDFREFKKHHCVEGNEKPECMNDNLLIANFNQEYVLKGEDIFLIGPKGVELNSFTSFISTLPVVKNLSPEEIEKVNKDSVKQSDIAKFGAKNAFKRNFVSPLISDEQSSSSSTDISSPFSPQGQVVDNVIATPLAGSTVTAAASPIPAVKPQESKQVAQPTDNIQEELNRLKAELEKSRRELAEFKDQKPSSQLEQKVKSLEESLFNKEKEYQKFIAAEKNKKATAASDSKIAGEEIGSEENDSTSTSDKPFAAASTGGSQTASDEFSGTRSSVGQSDSGAFGAGNVSGSSSSGSSAANSARLSSARLNSALLEKYGISVNGSTEAAILLGTDDKDPQGLQLLDGQAGSPVSMVVTSVLYEKFKVNDLEALSEIYKDKLKQDSQKVIKISITSHANAEALEFYAVHEGGKVIFQPVRRYKLGDLKMQLN